jgi:hypothetical protein
MTREEHRAINEAAFPKLKPVIETSYPPKQFVAIAGGKIVADDADLYALCDKLAALGIDPMDTLVDRAGEDLSADVEFLGIALEM